MAGNTNFPTALDDDSSLYDVTDAVHTLQAAHHNNPKEAIKALEAKVGIFGTSSPTALDYRIGNPTNSHRHDGASGQGMPINATSIDYGATKLAGYLDGLGGGGGTAVATDGVIGFEVGHHAAPYVAATTNWMRFATAIRELRGTFFATSNPTAITIPTGADGMWEFGFAAQVGNHSHNNFTTFTLHRGGTPIGLNHTWPNNGTDTFVGDSGHWGPVPASGGDQINIRGWSNWAGTAITRFWGRRVGS